MYKANFGKEKSFAIMKYSFSNFISENKVFFILLIFFVVIGILTGVFTAVRYNGGEEIFFNDFSITNFIEGNLGSLSLFFSRLLSYEIVLVILFVSSFTIFLVPINIIVVSYRAYLLGLNSTVIILLYGLGGIFTTILIILPCQLVALFLIMLFSCLSAKRAICCKKYGQIYNDDILMKLLIFTILILAINLIETILLTIFSSKIILVI